VIDRVKGFVLGMAVMEVVMQGEGLSVAVTERVREPVTLLVKGLVLGIGVPETVIEVDMVGS